MNVYPNGQRLFFWQGDGVAVYGTVAASETLADGTQMLTIVTDDGRNLRLPASAVTAVGA